MNPVSRTPTQQNLLPVAGDLRIKWMFDYIQSSFQNIPEQLIRLYVRDNGQQIKKYLDEIILFKSIFFYNIYKEEEDVYKKRFLQRKARRQRRRNRRQKAESRAPSRSSKGSRQSSRKSSRAGESQPSKKDAPESSDEDDDSDSDGSIDRGLMRGLSDDDDDQSTDEDDIYTGPPPPILKMFVDKITDYIHPFDVNHVYFTRLERGPIPEPSDKNDVDGFLGRYMLRGVMDRDPIQMLYDYLNENPIVQKSVQAVGTSEENFEDKYIKNFYKTIESHAGKVEGELELRLPTELRALYHVPFSAKDAAEDADAVKALNDCCHEWIQSVEKVLNELQNVHDEDKAKKKDAKSLLPDEKEPKPVEVATDEIDNAVMKEIQTWETKLIRCKKLQEQLKMYPLRRALAILDEAGNVHAKTMNGFIHQVHILLEEAQDNVKFLGTIRKPTEVLVTSHDFKEMRMTLPNLMNSLRNIWMLSKHYNTDEQICGLLDKITNIILTRVRGFVDFDLLHTPNQAVDMALECRSLLTGWHESFLKTRQAIEESGREARWEFSVQKQFNHVQHAAHVCSDIASVADIISQLQFCFTEELIASTKNPNTIMAARQRCNENISSFAKLQYDAFDPTNAHHWQNHIAWFRREVRFIDAESATIAEEVYDHLQSAKLAIDALHAMMKTKYRQDIGKRFIAKVGLIIRKFILEIDEAEKVFLNQKEDPPLAENLPPISGAIYWSNDIEKDLNLTLKSLSAVSDVTGHDTWPSALAHFNTFIAKLHSYKVGPLERASSYVLILFAFRREDTTSGSTE